MTWPCLKGSAELNRAQWIEGHMGRCSDGNMRSMNDMENKWLLQSWMWRWGSHEKLWIRWTKHLVTWRKPKLDANTISSYSELVGKQFFIYTSSSQGQMYMAAPLAKWLSNQICGSLTSKCRLWLPANPWRSQLLKRQYLCQKTKNGWQAVIHECII